VFPSVITYFNEVPVAQLNPGRVLRHGQRAGPRGPRKAWNFGRVTNGGNVLLSPQSYPTADFGGYAGVKVGNFGFAYDQRCREISR